MAETLGSLCDKLTIVKLKLWHCDDAQRRASLAAQAGELAAEIDEFVADARAGRVPRARLTFPANKVYRRDAHEVAVAEGELGTLVGRLAHVNCELWHEQEKVYAFTALPVADKDRVVHRLAVLNLERNACIEAIDRRFVAQLAPVGGPA